MEPPPLPEPPAAPGLSRPRQALLALVIVLGLFLVFSVARAIVGGVRSAAAPPPVNPTTRKLFKPQPLTESQKQVLAQFAGEVVEELARNDVAAQVKLIDLAGLTARIVSGTRIPEDTRRMLQLELARQPATILQQLAGSRCRVLRVGQRDDHASIVIRSESAEGGLSYCDIIVQPRGDRFGIVDLFSYTFGGYATADMQDATLRLLAADKRLARQLRIEGKSDSVIATALLETSRAIAAEDWEGAIRLIRSAPASARNHRSLRIMYIRALSSLQDKPEYQAEFATAVKDARKTFGTNSAPELLFYDIHCQQKDYASAMRDVDLVMEVIGADAALLNLKADASLRNKQTEVARRCLEEAERLEPEYPKLIDLKLLILASERKFKEAAETIKDYFGRIQAKPTEDMFSDELYEEFRKSAEFKALFDSP